VVEIVIRNDTIMHYIQSLVLFDDLFSHRFKPTLSVKMSSGFFVTLDLTIVDFPTIITPQCNDDTVN